MDVGKKGIPDAVETAPGEASGKTFFPTHQTGVGHATSRKGQINFKKHIIPDAVHSASGTASGIGDFPDPRGKKERKRGKKRGRSREEETFPPPSLDVVLSSSLAVVPPPSATSEIIKILKKCKEAIPSRGEGEKVIIIEMVLEQMKKSSVETQLCCDVLMRTTFSGRERNEKEWNTLFLAVVFGFKVYHCGLP
ncbi:trans-resveratrol di-O-methyltransferase-like [Cucumis melo var. makuwa]|uniref:Trans-resveratrol di-O-methyltransferase-like n=1 Tax=Cucumis melo var. makuwa TaxID=1194695 RepID=A0A5D3DCG2_CUCMM|nr:trans-resveratrol di-O-methyltransferase-like [Cucumis melo var. makuwa]TYK21262.1 trans-resveratrol di-O-methyltransferase-like [Cucumis melo var. makuwa]